MKRFLNSAPLFVALFSILLPSRLVALDLDPVRVGGYDTSGRALRVAVSGNYAYVADWDAGLQVIDVSNPANPQRVGGYDTSGGAYGVAVLGNYAYMAPGTCVATAARRVPLSRPRRRRAERPCPAQRQPARLGGLAGAHPRRHPQRIFRPRRWRCLPPLLPRGHTVVVKRIVNAFLCMAHHGGGVFNDGSASGSASLAVSHSSVSDNSACFCSRNFNNGVNGNADLTVTASALSGNSQPHFPTERGFIFPLQQLFSKTVA